jgi:intein-encoded DNA endonuclease-like protein
MVKILNPHTMDNQQVIIQTYLQTQSTLQTAKALNQPYRAILATLQKAKILKKRKSSRKAVKFDLNFFETIDTEAKAYFYGLFKADGYVDKQRNRFEIRLQLKDKELIEAFLFALGLPHTYLNVIKPTRPEQQPNVSFSIKNEEFVQHLLTLKSPESLTKIPNELAHHFIRGYFDGDGTIAYRNRIKTKLRYQVAIVGSPRDTHVLDYINSKIPIPFPNIYVDKRSDLPFLKSDKIEFQVEFGKFLYKDATIFLSRKHLKFVDLIYRYKTSTTTRETSST